MTIKYKPPNVGLSLKKKKPNTTVTLWKQGLLVILLTIQQKYCWRTAQERIQILFMSVLKRKGGFAFHISVTYTLKVSPSFRSGLHRHIKMSCFWHICLHRYAVANQTGVGNNKKNNPQNKENQQYLFFTKL